MVSSLSELVSNETTSKSNERRWSSSQDFENSMETMIPNGNFISLSVNIFLEKLTKLELIALMIFIGAIVAIQDIDQHMYFTVEGGENEYSLGGAVHYSLVGERALFRVWNFSMVYISISRRGFEKYQFPEIEKSFYNL